MARRYYSRRRTKNDTSHFIIVALLLLGLAGLLTQFPLFSNVNLQFVALILAGIGIAFGIAILLYFSQKEKKRKRALTLSQIDSMTGVEFEYYLGDLLKSQSYKVQYIPMTGDFGTDIIAEKDHRRYSIQAKRYHGKVGPPAIQQAVTALKVYKCDQAIVITNSYFTKEAKELAKYNDCKLIDRSELTDWILEFQKSKPKLIG